jgi:hypothetical protein
MKKEIQEINSETLVNGQAIVNALVRKFFSEQGKKGHALAKKRDFMLYKEKQKAAADARWKNHKKARK